MIIWYNTNEMISAPNELSEPLNNKQTKNNIT